MIKSTLNGVDIPFLMCNYCLNFRVQRGVTMFFRFKKGIIGLCVAMMVTFGIVVYSGMEVSASSSAVSKNAVKDTGKSGISIKINGKVKELNKYDGSIKKSKGNAKFKKSSGYVKSEFFVYKKAVYYANSKGNLASGWEKIKGSYYFFGRSSYKMARNKSVEKVTLTKYGVAEGGAKNKARAKSYVKADNVMEAKTKASDSKSAKLKKCFNYVMNVGYKQYRKYKDVKGDSNWDVTFANDVFNNNLGCCVSKACAFGYLAAACGYDKVTICCDTSHAWTDIDGKLFDPVFAKSKGYSKNYNSSYYDYRRNAAVKVKL